MTLAPLRSAYFLGDLSPVVLNLFRTATQISHKKVVKT